MAKKKKRKTDKNLIPFNELTQEERRRIAQMGGQKSVEVRRERKKLKELLEIALLLPDEDTGEQNDFSITSALIKEAKKGNVNAYTVIRDTLGEKPTEKHDLTGGSEEVRKAYLEAMRNLNADKMGKQ
nr:MAG TPA: hypothetical protein [Caudoviricetes sp.]